MREGFVTNGPLLTKLGANEVGTLAFKKLIQNSIQPYHFKKNQVVNFGLLTNWFKTQVGLIMVQSLFVHIFPHINSQQSQK